MERVAGDARQRRRVDEARAAREVRRLRRHVLLVVGAERRVVQAQRVEDVDGVRLRASSCVVVLRTRPPRLYTYERSAAGAPVGIVGRSANRVRGSRAERRVMFSRVAALHLRNKIALMVEQLLDAATARSAVLLP